MAGTVWNITVTNVLAIYLKLNEREREKKYIIYQSIILI
jgi:hypothetical protein